MALEPVVISLRRPTSDKSWGFALQGGVDQGLPVFVHKVTRNGIAHKSGLEPGDVVIKICATPVTGMTHAQVKAEILRAGNDLDFMVKKRDFNVVQYNQTMQQIAAANKPVEQASGSPEPRAEIVEEHLWRHGGPTFKNVQPKSYKILEQQLPQSNMGVIAKSFDANQSVITKSFDANQSGPAPGSVFDRSLDERSPYLQATEKTIQKAYGES